MIYQDKNNMKATKTDVLSIIFDTLMQNTDNPQFDLGESACEVVDYIDGTITFSYGGEEFQLKLDYK